MIIEKIFYKKSGVTVKLDDGTEYAKLNAEAVVRFSLKEGEEITDAQIAELLNVSDRLKAKAYVFDMLSRGARSECEVKRKLYEKRFSSASVEYAISLAKEYGYINDENFAASYVATYKNDRGMYRLKKELRIKGVSDEIINEATAIVSNDEEEAIVALAAKFIKEKPVDRKLAERLFRYLASRGFSFDAINSVMSTLKIVDD